MKKSLRLLYGLQNAFVCDIELFEPYSETCIKDLLFVFLKQANSLRSQRDLNNGRIYAARIIVELMGSQILPEVFCLVAFDGIVHEKKSDTFLVAQSCESSDSITNNGTGKALDCRRRNTFLFYVTGASAFNKGA